MNAMIFAIVPAMAFALDAAPAREQAAPYPVALFDSASRMDRSPLLRPYDPASAMAANTAYLGDGSDPSYLRDQEQLRNEPGYSIGTGAARVNGT
jgi:hypothetical protein